MSRTYVPEEDQRVADKSALKDLYPSEKRTVYLESEDNTYFWDPSGDASNANGDTILSSNEPGFQDGEANEGVWRLSPTDLSRKNTDDLLEGSNLYFTDARARNSLSATGDISYDPNTGEFSVTSYSSSDFNSDFSSKTTDDLVEGSSHLYFTEERVDDRIDSLLTPGLHLSASYNDASNALILDVDDNLSSYSNDVGFISDLSGFTTDDLAEGASNRYYTSDRVKNEFEAGGDLNYKKYPVDGFDLSIGSYSGTSFYIGSEDVSPRGLAFNNDGTKMFLTGLGNENVYEYNLSTGFDISTASYSGTSLDVSSEDSFPIEITFNGDGTKMFMNGSSGETIHAYGLSTAFDLSTASYSGENFSIPSQQTSYPEGLAFSSDGSKMFVVGDEGGSDSSVHQYNLSTNFDVSTASYSGTSFNVSSEYNGPVDVVFNSDGMKMFMLGGGAVFEYNLNAAFDISTASYTGTSFTLGSEDNQQETITFSSDGLKMFALGDQNDSVYEYSVGVVSNKARFYIDISETGNFVSSSSTDDLTEGSTNLYFTNERVDDRVDQLLNAGNGVTLSYDDASNSLTIAAQDVSSEDIQDSAWNVLSGTQSLINVTYDDPNSEVNFTVEPNLSNYTNDSGFISDLSGFTTDDLTEGSTNLYYSEEKVDDRINQLLDAGNGVTLNYDDASDSLTIAAQDVSSEDIQDSAWSVLTGTQSLINVSYDDPNGEVNFTVEPNLSNYTNDAGFLTDLNAFTTDNLTEGSYNLYYTEDRVDNRVDEVLPTGQDAFSGDGNKEQFQIAHGLGSKPNTWLISSASNDASGISHTTADDTTLYVNYDSAPPSGTGNVVINWMAVGLGTNVAPLWEDQEDVEYEK